ncbi:hypothetical protein [Nocardia sp. NPDC004711]
MSTEDDRAKRWAKGTATRSPREIDPEDLCMDSLLTALSHHGLDRIDAAIADYRATRVPDPREALWRTDYTRVHMRHDLAEDRPWPDHPDAIWLRDSASEIKQKWATDPEIAPRWAELNNFWIKTGGSSFFPPSGQDGLPTMPGEAPPGMDPVTWRSQAQARDLAGHYRWPDITTTTNREDTEPMNDITHPEHTVEAPDWADEGYGPSVESLPGEPEYEYRPATPEAVGIESETEQQMRADFMHAWGSYSADPDRYDPADELAYTEYSHQWVSDERWIKEWVYLEDATLHWRENLDITAEIGDVEADTLSPIRRRSEAQARYIAEHGIERDEHGLLSSHYVTRVENRAALVAALSGDTLLSFSTDRAALSDSYGTRVEERGEPAAGTPSPLADYQPSNALAAHLENSERDGFER